MPNAFAYLVLFSWPLVALALFGSRPPVQALVWSVVTGYLLLPSGTGVDFPLIPAIDKALVINLAAVLVSFSALQRARREGTWSEAPAAAGRARWLFAGLVALTLATPLVTTLTNSEPVIAGPRYIPGLSLYDAGSLMMSGGIAIVPFLLGLRFLGTPEAHAALLRALAIAGVAYALLVLFEVRMSPQLHTWVYGFFPHSWLQHVRGGFRPVVFLSHGLWLGMFLCMAVLAACALWRQALREQVAAAPWLAAVLWLAVTLVLSKNLGATMLVGLFAPIILFLPVRLQLLAAAGVAGLVLVYPMMRGAGLVPTGAVHSVAAAINEDRAASFKYRLDNEDILLDRANEKPFAGWGSWGRNRVYDPETGRDLSTTDGLWVITIGSWGWFGYLAQFGLLTAPLLLLGLRQSGSGLAQATAGLAVLLAANLLYLIPNSALSSLGWLAAGALAASCVQVAQGGPKPARLEPAFPVWIPESPAGPLTVRNPEKTTPRSGQHERRSRL